jgi:hypothetical protein
MTQYLFLSSHPVTGGTAFRLGFEPLAPIFAPFEHFSLNVKTSHQRRLSRRCFPLVSAWWLGLSRTPFMRKRQCQRDR